MNNDYPVALAPDEMAALENELLSSGYRQAFPSFEAALIDQNVCESSACSDCGHIGLEYKPFTKVGSYRAFAVCPGCGKATEF